MNIGNHFSGARGIAVVILAGAMLLITGAQAQLSGNYTINSGAATGGTNFQTFAAATAALSTSGVSGPVTITVVATSGPYTERVTISTIAGTSATNTVTFQGNGETLRHSPTTTDIAIVDINGATYVTINNLVIVGQSTTAGVGVLLRGSANYNSITNCTIDLSAVSSTTSTVSAHIAISNSITSTTTSGTNANYCTFSGNLMKGGSSGGPYYGVTVMGTSSTNASNGNSFIDNTIEDFYARGMHLSYTNGTIIRGNHIRRPNRTASTSLYGMYFINGSRAERIEKNRLYNMFGGSTSSSSAFYGIYFATPNTPLGAETNVTNNAIYNIAGNGAHYGVYFSYGGNIRAYHNTINFDYSSSTGGAVYGFYNSSSATTTTAPDIRNNIVTITRAGTGTKYCMFISSTSLTISDHNVLYINAPAGTNYTGSYNALNYATLANWQTANNNAYDQNSVAADPSYQNASAGDLKPQATAVNNLGTNLTAIVPDDILNLLRSGTPDMGAWEVQEPMTVSTIVTAQPITSAVQPSSTNQPIIRIEITAAGILNPLGVTRFVLSTNGTTNSSDITTAKVFYTGTSNTFSTSAQFGAAVSAPSGPFTVTGTQALTAPGTHYFWVAYDVSSTAANCNALDAECSSVTISAAGYIPSPTAPAGVRYIKTALSGTYVVDNMATQSCTNYTSTRDAIADVTQLGISGPVTFNVAAGHTETSSNMLLQTTTSNSTNTITFQKSGSGANPLITAAPGTGTLDGVIKIAGTDFVTFDGIDVQESATNTDANSRMEWGYAILKASTTDGAQNVTVKNSTIALNKAHTASIGIYQYNHTPASSTTLTITNFSGTSSYNTYINNTITNCYHGMYLYGASDTTYYDHGVNVGVGGGNAITNWAGGSSTAYGIYMLYHDDLRIANNDINSVFNHTGALYGINLSTATGANLDVYDNIVSISDSATTSTSYAIYSTTGSSGTANTVNISNNTVTGCKKPRVTSGSFYGIYHSATPFRRKIDGNEVLDNIFGSASATATGTIYLLYVTSTTTTAGSVHTISDNIIRGNARIQSAAGSGTNYIYWVAGGGVTTNMSGNQAVSNNLSSTGILYGYYLSGGNAIKNFYENRLDSLQTIGGTTYAWYQASGTEINAYRNTISNVTATGSGAILYGMYTASGTTVNLANNYVYSLYTPASSSTGAIYGVYVAGSTLSRVYYNTIYLDASSSATSFGAVALYASTTPTLDLRNNILINASYPGGTSGSSIVYQRSSATLATFADSANNNCYYGGPPSATNLIFSDGTFNAQTVEAYKAHAGPLRETASFNETVVPFVNKATLPYNLHISPTAPTACESGATRITTIAASVDFDGHIRYGESGYTGAGTAPDVGADEGNFGWRDALPPLISYAPLGNATAATSRAFQNVTITDVGGVNGSSGTRPRVYYRKGILYNEWNDNTSATEGWKWVEANGGSSPFDFTIDYSKLPGGAVAGGDTILYFVTAQDLAAAPNVAIQAGLFASLQSSVALTSAAFPISGTVNSYRIVTTTLSGSYNIGTGYTYTTLTGTGGLFEAINSNVLTGDVTAVIMSDMSEPGTHALDQWSEQGGSNFRLLIRPSDTATVTKHITGSPAVAMIRLNGADRVTIDGRHPVSAASHYLRFLNTNASYPTMSLANGVQNTVVRHSIIEGANSGTSGVLLIGASTTPAPNSGIRISDNVIRDRSDAAGVPNTLISVESGLSNTTDTLANNALFNFTSHGIRAQAIGDGWVIDGNQAHFTATASTQLVGIAVGGGNGHKIRGNSIGGSDAVRGGPPTSTSTSSTPAFTGISVNGGSGAASDVLRNIIGNVACTNAGLYGIITASGNLNISNNRIGSSVSGSDTLYSGGTFYGVYKTGAGSLAIQSDTIGYVQCTSVLYPVYITGGDATISGNLITNTSAGSTSYGIYYSGGVYADILNNTITGMTGTSTLAGVYFTSAGGNNNISGNTITNLWNNTTHYCIYQTGALANIRTHGNTITNNTTASPTTSATMYGIYSAATGAISVSSNLVGNLLDSGAVTGSLFGIYTASTAQPDTIFNNTVTNLRNTSLQGPVRGIYVASTGNNLITANTISDLASVYQGSAYGLWAVSGVNTVQSNTIHTITTPSDSIPNTFTILGLIVMPAATSGNVVTQNTVYNLVNTSTRDAETVIGGIYVSNITDAVISSNRVYGLSSGSGLVYAVSRIRGIYNQAGGATVYSNNMVSIGNGVGARVSMSAAEDVNSTGSSSWYYNSFHVGGTSPGSDTTDTWAFRRVASGGFAIRNNVLFNSRSGGGRHFAIGNTAAGYLTNWNAGAEDFNLLVSSNANTIGEWGPWGYGFAEKTFSGWRDSSGGDYSLSTTSATVSPTTLFTAPNTADLSIVTSNAECWYVNGKGVAGALSGSIADDFGASNVRSTTLGVATDIGADEFTTSTTPPLATASGSPAYNTTTVYSFAGQNLASITWGAGGVLPLSINFRYFSGDNPPAPLTGNYSNAYANLVETLPGIGYTYSITFGYSYAWLGSISSESNIRLAKRDAGVWSFLAGSTVNTTNKTVTMTGLTSFSDFAMTDATNPLPVELTAFTARLRGATVHLAWRTASELNALRYEVQRRTTGEWTPIGSVYARGSVDTPSEYTFTDDRLPMADEHIYRLKMIDRDGTYEYSQEVRVSVLKADGFHLFANYPNPFNPATTISFSLPQEQHVTVRIIDATGRDVEVLHSGMLPAGVHSTLFFSRELPSGVYTCVVAAGAEMRTRRMVLAR